MSRSQEAYIPTRNKFYILPLHISPRYKKYCCHLAHTRESRRRHGRFREIPEPGNVFSSRFRLCVAHTPIMIRPT